MVRARLHVICGNCGCNDSFTYSIDPEGHDMSDEEVVFDPSVNIYCDNCGTIHDLSDTVEEKK